MVNDNGEGKRTTVNGATLQYDYNVEILGDNPQNQRENQSFFPFDEAPVDLLYSSASLLYSAACEAAWFFKVSVQGRQ